MREDYGIGIAVEMALNAAAGESWVLAMRARSGDPRRGLERVIVDVLQGPSKDAVAEAIVALLALSRGRGWNIGKAVVVAMAEHKRIVLENQAEEGE